MTVTQMQSNIIIDIDTDNDCCRGLSLVTNVFLFFLLFFFPPPALTLSARPHHNGDSFIIYSAGRKRKGGGGKSATCNAEKDELNHNFVRLERMHSLL